MMQDDKSFKTILFIKYFMTSMQNQLEDSFEATKMQIVTSAKEEVAEIQHLEEIELRHEEEVTQVIRALAAEASQPVQKNTVDAAEACASESLASQKNSGNGGVATQPTRGPPTSLGTTPEDII